jgi:enoyl-CoA hydratase
VVRADAHRKSRPDQRFTHVNSYDNGRLVLTTYRPAGKLQTTVQSVLGTNPTSGPLLLPGRHSKIAKAPMEYTTVKLDIADRIATVTLNRPPVNAQNAEMRAEITQLFDVLSDRDDVACIVLTGAGKIFSAGADIRERPNLAETPGAYGRHNRLVRECHYSIVECSKPVIAAINGAAMGAGFGLIMASDIWVASEEAFVSMPEINVGLAGGVTFVRQFFGHSRTRRMFFTGMKVSAQELYRLGLVEACLPADQLMPYAMDIAREMASKSPIALRLAKEAARLTEVMPVRDAYRYEQGNTVALSKTEDAKEAQRAFLEKRSPVYVGR